MTPIPGVAIVADPRFWWGVLKLMYLVGFGLYAAFSLVVLVQIKQMVHAVKSEFNGFISLIGWLHVAAAVGAFILALVVL
jgi:hypothetical protein